MLKPEKDKIREAVAAVLAVCAPLNRGDVLPHEAIEKAADCLRYQDHWNVIIRKFRNELLESSGKFLIGAGRGIACRPVVCVGYKLCEPPEHMHYCSKNRQRRVVRQLTRGLKELRCLPVDELSVHDQKLLAMKIDNMAHERRVVIKCVREQNAEIRKTDTVPLRPMATAT